MKKSEFIARQANKNLRLKLELERPFATELKGYFNSCFLKIKKGNNDFGSVKEILRKHQRRITNALLNNKKKGIDFVRIINNLMTCNEARINRSANLIDKTTLSKFNLSIALAREQIMKEGLLNPSYLLISKIAANIFKNYTPGRVKESTITETNGLLESSKKQIITDVQPTIKTAVDNQDVDLLEDVFDLTESWNVQEVLNEFEGIEKEKPNDEERRKIFGIVQNPIKVWATVGDDFVRDEHKEANKQKQPLISPFIVGGELLMFPGDYSLGASAWNVCNCRCSAIY